MKNAILIKLKVKPSTIARFVTMAQDFAPAIPDCCPWKPRRLSNNDAWEFFWCEQMVEIVAVRKQGKGLSNFLDVLLIEYHSDHENEFMVHHIHERLLYDGGITFTARNTPELCSFKTHIVRAFLLRDLDNEYKGYWNFPNGKPCDFSRSMLNVIDSFTLAGAF